MGGASAAHLVAQNRNSGASMGQHRRRGDCGDRVVLVRRKDTEPLAVAIAGPGLSRAANFRVQTRRRRVLGGSASKGRTVRLQAPRSALKSAGEAGGVQP